ncbi:MAG: hypothetical protein L3K26_13515, partial [Candidatus Hydrogenedentes bacterium]|nr:hypothetical protein [Candidatus Hydrogenedentota bacterium]
CNLGLLLGKRVCLVKDFFILSTQTSTRMYKSMKARGPFCFTIRVLFVMFVFAGTTQAASFRTPNFIVNAQSPEFAKRVGTAAEQFRKELSVMWTGKEMKNWSAPCPINVKVGQIGAGGATTFSFHNGEVFGWKMNIQGSEIRILDSVLPHEITHTILACRFRRPLPRSRCRG